MASWKASTALKAWFKTHGDTGAMLAMLLLMYASNVLASGAWLGHQLLRATGCADRGAEHRRDCGRQMGASGGHAGAQCWSRQIVAAG